MTPALLIQLVLPLVIAGNFLTAVARDHASQPPPGIVGKPVPEAVLVTEDGTTVRVSDFRGKWLLILFGSSRSLVSGAMSVTFSGIHRALHGRPFAFLQINNEPTVVDARLFSLSDCSGILTVPGRDAGPKRFRDLPPATWLLVDPNGSVRTGGNFRSLSQIRMRMAQAWAGDHEMPSELPAPSHVEALGSKAILHIAGDRYRQAREAAEEMLGIEPSNEVALRTFLFAGLFVDGYDATNKTLAERTKDLHVSDATQRMMLSSRLIQSDCSAEREAFDELVSRNPKSRYLRAIQLGWTKTPDDLTPADLELLQTISPSMFRTYCRRLLGFGRQWRGRLRLAVHDFRYRMAGKAIERLGLADTYKRLGWSDDAAQLIDMRADVTAADADSTESWTLQHFYSVTGDDEAAQSYAKRYQTVRPEKAQGFLMQRLLERLQGDADPATHEALRAAISKGERYRALREIEQSGRLPEIRDLTDIPDEHIRLDTALYFVLEHWDNNPQRARLLRNAQLAFLPDDWPYALVNHIRWRVRPTDAYRLDREQAAPDNDPAGDTESLALDP